MNIEQTSLPGVFLVEPKVFGDDRGYFMEAWHAERFAAAGIDARFVQENESRSRRGVLRGLHYQIQKAQGKLVRALDGEVFDVAVDVRKSSPHFGKWFGCALSAQNRRALYVPPGFAHGFYVTSAFATILYACTDVYAPEHERSIRWDDPEIGIEWPLLRDELLLSSKDAAAPRLSGAEVYP